MDPKELKNLGLKSQWQQKYHQIWGFYCPLCKVERRIPYRPKPGGFRQISQVALTSALITIGLWKWLAWKGILSFLPLWTGFEVIYRSRVRAALICSSCGFDPYLFLSNEEKAKDEIETHWRKKFTEKGIPYPERKTPADPRSPAPGP
jgi:hypothetical protein